MLGRTLAAGMMLVGSAALAAEGPLEGAQRCAHLLARLVDRQGDLEASLLQRGRDQPRVVGSVRKATLLVGRVADDQCHGRVRMRCGKCQREEACRAHSKAARATTTCIYSFRP